MNCGNCGKGNAYKAKVCAYCGSTLSLTEYFRPTGFVEKPAPPKEQAQKTAEQKKVPMPGERGVQTKSSSAQAKSSGSKQPATATKPTGKEVPDKKTAPKKDKTSNKTEKAPEKVSKSKNPAPKQTGKKPQAYNRTTNNLSIAEKMVRKKSTTPNRKWIFPLVLILLMTAIAIFVGQVQFFRNEERYTQVAEQFVQAVATNDDASASQCVHSKMHGSLRPLGYENVERCVTLATSYEELAVGQIGAELKERYEIDEPVTRLFRVHVEYTVYAAEAHDCSMDVLVANVGGKICAIKTENIRDKADVAE